jgi:hypothetical protein
MNLRVIVCGIFGLFFTLINVQAQGIPAKGTSKVWIKYKNWPEVNKGILFKATDSTIVLCPSNFCDSNKLTVVTISTIDKIKIRKNYQHIFDRALLVGLGTGIAAGTIASIVVGPVANGFGALLFMSFGLVGTTVGFAGALIYYNWKKTFKLGGSLEKYRKIQSSLSNRAVIKGA